MGITSFPPVNGLGGGFYSPILLLPPYCCILRHHLPVTIHSKSPSSAPLCYTAVTYGNRAMELHKNGSRIPESYIEVMDYLISRESIACCLRNSIIVFTTFLYKSRLESLGNQ